MYQEAIGDVYYEVLSIGPLVRRLSKKRLHQQ
jgi:cephalosporin hydroxylase